LNKKLDQARRQGEQNRASGSEPHSFNKIWFINSSDWRTMRAAIMILSKRYLK
jgi:hypothetical protein